MVWHGGRTTFWDNESWTGQGKANSKQPEWHMAAHVLGALMTVTMSENKIFSILIAVAFCTALVYFHYLLFSIVLNFFFSLVQICGIMLGRNTNLPLVQQTLLVPQLPQSNCFICFIVSEWHQLVPTQKNNPMGSTTTASQSSNSCAGTSFATGLQSVPPIAHPALQLSTPKASENIPVPHWHSLHGLMCSSDPQQRKAWTAGEMWNGNTWPFLF